MILETKHSLHSFEIIEAEAKLSNEGVQERPVTSQCLSSNT